MELNKKEKLIWKLSTKIELPDPPDKNEVWDRLAQSIETLDNQLKPAQDAGMLSLPEWKVQVQSIFNLKGHCPSHLHWSLFFRSCIIHLQEIPS